MARSHPLYYTKDNDMKRRSLGLALLLVAPMVHAHIDAGDRVYTADQNTNTVSVIDPTNNTLLGQIRLGNERPDVLSPLYKGELNVHGLGFSPDHRTLLVVSNGSNSVTFIDTASNTVKGIAYIGRSPHEAFFSADGKQVWAVVRGADYLSVIDPESFKEIDRIKTAPGPGMVLFHPDGKSAFVVHSFTAEVDVIDVATRKVTKRIPVTSPFSPFLQFTPDFKEVWLTHKDVGKVTRIDTDTLAVEGVIDTGMITNHLAFGKTAGTTQAYISIGGENTVKVYSTEPIAKMLKTIPVGALPHGIWSSDDGSRVYVGLENGDAVDVIDTASDAVIARVPVGQAPQALVFVSNATHGGDGMENLVPRVNSEPLNLVLKPDRGDASGFVVVRNLGLIDALEVFLFKLVPDTDYNVYASGQNTPVASFKTNAKGMANGTAIGPMRELVTTLSDKPVTASRLYVTEGSVGANPGKAVLSSTP